MASVTIERLGHHGDGIAPGPVFAARTLPGEIVEGVIAGDRLIAPKILMPSPLRVTPPCPHFKGCGGCALQHAPDEFVAEWKTDVVRTALSAHGLEAPIRRLHTSPPKARRRAIFSGRRTKNGALVGFHAPQSDILHAVPNCQLVRPALLAAVPFLERVVTYGGSRKSELRLTVTETETGMDILVEGGKPLDIELRQNVTKLAEMAHFARVTWDGEPVVTIARPVLTFGTAPVTPPPGGFLQATDEGEAALLVSISDAIGNPKRVLDLFSGCGTFSLPIARIAEVHAVESDEAMIAALDDGWRHASGVRKVTTERRDLFRRPLMPDEIARFDAVVIDPPRAGAEAQTRELAKARVKSIAFVSCNPVTFARDAAILTDSGYQLDWIDIVDQFRWSSHVELAARFSLDGK